MKKKLIPIIALALIAVIAITTVVFAICSVNYKPNFTELEKCQICIQENSSGALTLIEDEEQSKKLNDLFNSSFNESALNSLFNGRLGYSAELIKNQTAISDITKLDKYIYFDYINKDNLPTIKYNNEDISFDRLLIKIESLNTTNLGQINIYLLQEDAISSSYYYKTYGNFYNFFKYINETVLAE